MKIYYSHNSSGGDSPSSDLIRRIQKELRKPREYSPETNETDRLIQELRDGDKISEEVRKWRVDF